MLKRGYTILNRTLTIRNNEMVSEDHCDCSCEECSDERCILHPSKVKELLVKIGCIRPEEELISANESEASEEIKSIIEEESIKHSVYLANIGNIEYALLAQFLIAESERSTEDFGITEAELKILADRAIKAGWEVIKEN